MQSISRLSLLLLLVGGALFLAGCSAGGLAKKTCYPVKGELTVGGKPAEGATVMFQPRDANPADWSAGYPRATVGADGRFQVSTYGENDGAPAGEYDVTIAQENAFVRKQPLKKSLPTATPLPAAFKDRKTSKLVARVEAAELNELPAYDLK